MIDNPQFYHVVTYKPLNPTLQIHYSVTNKAAFYSTSDVKELMSLSATCLQALVLFAKLVKILKNMHSFALKLDNSLNKNTYHFSIQ